MQRPVMGNRKDRKLRSPRFSFLQRSVGFYMVPCAWAHVCPGETFDSAKLRFKVTGPAADVFGVGAYMETRAFYVPMRLMWEDWPSFLMGQTAFDFPTYADYGVTGTYWGSTADTDAAYPIAAMRRIYADWYGQRDDAPALASGDIGFPIPRPDRTFLSGVREDAEDIDALVSTAGDQFYVGKLDEAYVARDQAALENFIDGNYLTYLRLAGVDASQTAIEKAEPIYRYRRWMEPVSVFAEDGSVAERYQSDFDLSMRGRRFFPEHGIIVVMTGFMPKVFINSTTVADQMVDPEHFPHSGMPVMGDRFEFNPGIGETISTTARDMLWFGEDQHNRSLTTEAVDMTVTSLQDAVWPSNSALLAILYATAGAWPVVKGVFSPQIKTPLRRRDSLH